MKITKLTSLLIAVLLVASLFSALVSCSDTGNAGGDTTAAADAATTVEDTSYLYDSDGYLKDSIPDELDYAGKTFTILACNEQKSKTWAESDDGDLLTSALYYRLLSVEERLGIKLDFVWENGNWNNRAAFMDKVKASVNNNSGEYDLVMAYNLNPPQMAVDGLLSDLSELRYLDLSKPWWPEKLVETATVNEHIYFAIDNSSAGSIRNMASIMFDKTLIETYNITANQLYDLALGKEWTIDKLEELIEGVYSDLNNDNTVNYGDLYGFAAVDKPRLDAFFYGSGLTIVGKDSSGNLTMRLGDEKNQSVLERLCDLFHNNEFVLMSDEKMYTMFKNHQVLFYDTPIAIVDQKLDFDFGVLPVPMLNAEQENYITYISNTHDSWCIPLGAKDEELSGAVIECLASESYRKVAPAYFETMLKYKYSSDDKAAQVYDIIRDTVIFDFGYMFGNSFSQNPFLLYRNALASNNQSWTTIYKIYSKAYDTELSDIIAKLSDPN